MRKIISVITAAALMITAVSCGELSLSPYSDDASLQEITMKTQFDTYKSDFEKIQLVLHNSSGGSIEFGTDYSVEVMTDGKWRSLPLAENSGFNSLLVIIEEGGDYSFTVSRNMFDHKFQNGSYRVVKKIGDGYASAEFKIADDGIGKDNPYGYYELSTLPEDYGADTAISDGCVNISNMTDADTARIESFLEGYLNGTSSQLRYFSVTESGLVIYDILYDRPAGARIRLTKDESRAGGEVWVKYYSSIVTDGERLYLSDSHIYDEGDAEAFMNGAVLKIDGELYEAFSEKSDEMLLATAEKGSAWSPDGMRNVQYGFEAPLDFGITVLYADGGNSGSVNSLPGKLESIDKNIVGIENAAWVDEITVVFTVMTEDGEYKEVLYDTDYYRVIG